MKFPRLGVGLPHCGPHANPGAILEVATAVERLGFSSVWAFDRLLLPVSCNGENEYGLPKSNATIYDPLETLTWVAAKTERIRLGTSIFNALYHPPVILARRLATLDQLSGGRFTAGLGQGWMAEEYAVAGLPISRRGAGFEEHLAAMRACWGPDPVEFAGTRYQIPRSAIGPKPLNGSVPLLIGGISQPAIERAARLQAGFAAVFQDWDTLRTQIFWYREAGGSGSIVLRVNVDEFESPEPTVPFAGTITCVADDLSQAASEGVNEVFFDLNHGNLEPSRQIESFKALADALSL